MPAYLVAVYTCADRAAAKAVWGNLDPNDCAVGEAKITVHDAPPVVLAGLVKGGEIATAAEYEMSPTLPRHFVLLVDASGRVVADRAGVGRALRTGAFPLTWYQHEET